MSVCPNCMTAYSELHCPQCEWLREQLQERLREECSEVATIAQIVSWATHGERPELEAVWRIE